MSRTGFRPYLKCVQRGEALSAAQAADAFAFIMAGRVPEDDLADFLLAQARRGPTVAEITGAARAMRASMLSVETPAGAMDLCGTGGDGLGTLNISTAVSFVVAACGVPVAKHGNRNMSSRTGAADVLEALGVNVSLPPDAASACLREAGICFLFAPAYHPAMKHVAPVRRQLGIRTIFNLLGPLCNPAKVRRQLLGVYAREWIAPLATVLHELDTERAWVVHGSDGMDELTITGATNVAALERGDVTSREAMPEEAGVARGTLTDLKGGDAVYNAEAVRRLFNGEGAPAYRDIVLLNAAAALVIAEKARDLRDGHALAAAALNDGRARAMLRTLAEISQELGR
jgi:anthranilate phosphoribosyltransferase